MRTIDVWKTERETAEVLECGLKVKRGSSIDGKPTLMIWKPKALKPYANYRFLTREQADAYLERQVNQQREVWARREVNKILRKGSEEDRAKVQVGSIFHYSWGYDQTNCDFFQVVAMNGRRLTLQEIGQQSVEGSQGFMSESRIAVKDAFLKDSKPFTKLLQFTNGKPYITMNSYGWCELWDGKPEYASWYA